MKQDLQARISAMSAVHEHFYRLDQFSEVDAMTLIPGIVEPIRLSFDSTAIIDYDIDALLIDRDQATPLALLVSEVMTNALKYAYGPGESGRIVLSLKLVDGREMVLSVRDFGRAFDPATAPSGLGMRLIRAMATQLDGRWSYSFDQGTLFEMRMPARASRAPAPPILSGQAPGAAELSTDAA
jgi:two-component sensor histidine kinase